MSVRILRGVASPRTRTQIRALVICSALLLGSTAVALVEEHRRPVESKEEAIVKQLPDGDGLHRMDAPRSLQARKRRTQRLAITRRNP